MAVDYVREGAEQLIRRFVLGGVGLAVLGGVVVGVALSADSLNTWLLLGGIAGSWAGSAVTFVGLVGWGVKLGTEASIRRP